MNINVQTTRVPQVDLMRVVPRAQRVLALYAAQDPTLEALRLSFDPTSTKFVAAHAQVKALAARARASHREGQAAIALLGARLLRWVNVIEATVTPFDRRDYRMDTLVPDEVFKRVEQLLAVAASSASPLPYLELMAADLGEALETSRHTWLASQRLMADEQTARAAARVAAAEVQRLLVSVRRTLRSILGSSHRDYRKLLVRSSGIGEQPAAEEMSEIETEVETDEGFFGPQEVNAA